MNQELLICKSIITDILIQNDQCVNPELPMCESRITGKSGSAYW